MPIHDLGYQRYKGKHLPHRTRYKVLIQRVLSLAWASGLVKTTIILGLFPMVVCAVIMFFKMKAMQLFTAKGVPIQMEDPGLYVFYCIYWCQIWFAFAMSLLVAAPSISEDVRTGAFQFYFSRPVTSAHYLVGKMVPVAVLVLVVSAVPGICLALVRMGLATSGEDAWNNLPLLLSTLVYGPVFALVMALPPVALSALGRRTGTIQGLWATIFFLSWLLGEGTAALSDIEYMALLSIPTNLRLLGQYLYGMPPGYDIPWYYPAAVLLTLCVGSAVILLRRLEKVEVFA